MAALPPGPLSSLTSSAAPAATFIDANSQPGPTALTLGTVSFFTSECPDDLEFGVQQYLKVHDLIGGGRDIQVMGSHPDPVTWSGRIWANNIDVRVASLRSMFKAAQEVKLTYDTESYFCVIRNLKIKRLQVDAIYTITVEISRDANGALSSASTISVDSQVSALLNDLAVQNASIASIDPNGSAAVQQSQLNVMQSVSTAGPIAQLSGSNLTSALNVVTAAIATATAYAGSLSPGASQYVQAQRLVTLYGLIARNMQNGQSQATVQVMGESLAVVAARQYGNADFAPQLAAANGIQGLRTAPGVLTTLTLPPFV